MNKFISILKALAKFSIAYWVNIEVAISFTVSREQRCFRVNPMSPVYKNITAALEQMVENAILAPVLAIPVNPPKPNDLSIGPL